MTKQTKTILKDVFGYKEFLPLQQEIIKNLLNHKDTLVIMPTGGGKSLCYQIPALIFKGLTVVISPLISLMKDQVEQLTELSVKALFLNSTLSDEEYRMNIESILKNDVRLLYLAPETLLMPKTLDLLSSIQVDCITIDEAHCISEWGHDFRPEYRQLIEIRERFPKSVCMALTATATPQVQQDIKESLRFETSNEFIASFNRKNLFLQIKPKTNPAEQTVQFLKEFPNQSGIIYCFTRRQVDELSEYLAQAGFSVKPYHAGLSDEERRKNQELFIRDDIQIMVATIAFGMGINKPNIRFIVHYDLPKNIESYYQQIGRAGRDGLDANCMLLFSYADIQKIKYFINQKEDNERRIANIHLSALIGFAETDECRRIPLLRYFGESYSVPECEMCDNCISEKQPLTDVTLSARNFLSCVDQTGEVFGSAYVIDVLRGSQSQKIINNKHNKLPTYGIDKECSKKRWTYLSRQFIQKGLVLQDMEYGSLKLTPKACEILQGKENVFAKDGEREDGYAQSRRIDKESCDSNLFELLRQKRKKLAEDADLPPYVIFPDRTLIEMAAFFPQSEDSVRQLHGVGSVKWEKYGQQFLDLISDYSKEHQIDEKPIQRVNTAVTSSRRTHEKRKHTDTGEEFNAGKSLTELQEHFNIKLSTVLSHLYKYTAEGYTLRNNHDFLELSTLSPDQRVTISETFDQLGTEFLKPIFEALNEEVSYDELHLLRLHYCVENQREAVK